MYSVSHLLGNRIKPTNERFGMWFLLENLRNNNLLTDIGNINYCEGEPKLNNLTSITDAFCDNIMLVKITNVTDCDGDVRNQLKVKKEICGSFNSYLRGIFKKFSLARHGVVAKLPFSLEKSSRVQSEGVLQIIKKDIDQIKQKYEDPIAIPYKIELANVKIKDLLEDLPKILQDLEKEMYYLMDFDITLDLAGIFNKEEMCQYLTENFDFCHQGEYKDGYNIIVDNNFGISKDCLTWFNVNSKVKIYNKFVCQITSPGVVKSIGNHIINFVNCPDARLKETFASKLARENGITRLEATIYNYCRGFGKEFEPLRDCLSLIEDNKRYFQNAPFYAVPLHKMWTKVANQLQNSCCLVFNDLLQYAYWGNSNTKKITGVQLKLPEDSTQREKLIKYALSAFSFNCLPTNYVEVIGEYPDTISVKHKCYIKSGGTCFTRSNTPFSIIPKHINLEELGLVESPNLAPYILRSRTNITNKLYPYTIKEIEPLSKPLLERCSKKRKLELEDIDTNKRKLEYVEKTVAVKEEYKAQLAREQEVREREDKLKDYFLRRWEDLEHYGHYIVYAFVVNNKNKFTYVGVLAEKDGQRAVYYVKGVCKTAFIEINKNREGYSVLPYTGDLDIIYLPNNEPLASFNTNGTATFYGNSFPKIENLSFRNTVWDTTYVVPEDIEMSNAMLMQDIKGNIKFKECSRLEDLEDGVELLISAIKQVEHRGRKRYIVQFENIRNLYASNHWLEKELESGKYDFNYKLKIKLDKIKTTPNKHKERLVFCV